MNWYKPSEKSPELGSTVLINVKESGEIYVAIYAGVFAVYLPQKINGNRRETAVFDFWEIDLWTPLTKPNAKDKKFNFNRSPFDLRNVDLLRMMRQFNDDLLVYFATFPYSFRDFRPVRGCIEPYKSLFANSNEKVLILSDKRDSNQNNLGFGTYSSCGFLKDFER